MDQTTDPTTDLATDPTDPEDASMPGLTTSTVYSLARDDEGRVNKFQRDLIAKAARWYPDDRAASDQHVAWLLHLREGDTITQARLDKIIGYCHRSRAYYLSEPEPVEGRNAEAVDDFEALLDLLGESQ